MQTDSEGLMHEDGIRLRVVLNKVGPERKVKIFLLKVFLSQNTGVFLIKGSASCGVLSQRSPDMRSKGPFPASPLDWDD